MLSEVSGHSLSDSSVVVAVSTPPLSAAGVPATRFDRERIVLYVAAAVAVTVVSAFYLWGYLLPALAYGRAIVDAARRSSPLPTGCYLLFLEHANRLQSAYAIRFLGMLIGIAIVFVGMLFTIKGLEAGYSLDLQGGSNTASLKTASPGLVLCTLGIALVFAAVLHTSDLTFQNLSSCFEH